MPITGAGWEILVERVKEERRDNRIRTRGKYQVFRDGVLVAGLGGSCVEARGPGDNSEEDNGKRIEQGRYPLGTHDGTRFATINYPNTGRRPALKLNKTNKRTDILIHPASGFKSTIGCINLSRALVRLPDRPHPRDGRGARHDCGCGRLRETHGAGPREEPRRWWGGNGAEDHATARCCSRLAHMKVKPTDDTAKFLGRPVVAKVEAIWNGEDFDEHAEHGRKVAVILNRTNFYAEQGGQAGDSGSLRGDSEATSTSDKGNGEDSTSIVFKVEDTQVVGPPGSGHVLHIGYTTDGELRVGDEVQVSIEKGRREPIRANHTSTHLLNFRAARNAWRTHQSEGVTRRRRSIEIRFLSSRGDQAGAD